MAQPEPQQVPVEVFVEALLDLNRTLLDRFVILLESLEANLTGEASPDQLQGEIEELLRLIISAVEKAIDRLLALQHELQSSIIESFFPAQD